MQPELSSSFVAGEVGIADKPEMRLEAGLGEGLTQASDAAGNAAGPGIPVGAFKADYMKLHGDIVTVLHCSFKKAPRTPFELLDVSSSTTGYAASPWKHLASQTQSDRDLGANIRIDL